MSIINYYLPFTSEILFTTILLQNISDSIYTINKKEENHEDFLDTFFMFMLLIILTYSNNFFVACNDFLFVYDLNIKTIKLFVLWFCFLSYILIWRSFRLQGLIFFEYNLIYLMAILALLNISSSFNLISLYLSLEFQSISFYVLAAMHRKSIFSSEAGLKYFISSSLMSGIFLLGSVLIYGSLGTTQFKEMYLIFNYILTINYLPVIICALSGIICIFITILFKLVISPFHLWFPQIYDGSPLGSTIIFSTIPKIILFALLIKVWSILATIFSGIEALFFLIGAYSIFFGNLKLIKQERVKKFYIYSSISQMGLLICAVVNSTVDSHTAIYFLLIAYLISSIILWGVLVLINYNQNRTNELNKNNIKPLFLSLLSNFFKQNSILSILYLFVFFSLAAIPPFIGFLSKVSIFLTLISKLKYEISAIIIYLSVFGIYYYIKFLKIIFFENLKKSTDKVEHSFFSVSYLSIDCFILSLALFFLIFFFCLPGQYWDNAPLNLLI